MGFTPCDTRGNAQPGQKQIAFTKLQREQALRANTLPSPLPPRNARAPWDAINHECEHLKLHDEQMGSTLYNDRIRTIHEEACFKSNNKQPTGPLPTPKNSPSVKKFIYNTMNPTNPYGRISQQSNSSDPCSSLNSIPRAEDFTGTEDWESRATELIDEASIYEKKLETLRKIAAIDSIRSGIAHATQNSGAESSLTPKTLTYKIGNDDDIYISSPPSHKVSFFQDPSAISQAIAKLHATVKQCFDIPQSGLHQPDTP